jgi:intron-binding protein aquarius
VLSTKRCPIEVLQTKRHRELTKKVDCIQASTFFVSTLRLFPCIMSSSFKLKTKRGRKQIDSYLTATNPAGSTCSDESNIFNHHREGVRDKSESFESLYAQCINELSGAVDWKMVQAAVLNQSAAETIVWPAIIRQSFGGTICEDTEYESTKVQFKKATILFVILTSWEYREGNALDALHFIKKSDDNVTKIAWENLCKDIFCTKKESCTTGSNKYDAFTFYSIQTIKIHFMTICWITCQISDTTKEWFCKPLLSQVSGIKIWKSIPERVRDLELKKQTQNIQKKWKQNQQCIIGNEETSFIVDVIQKLLSLMEVCLFGNINITKIFRKRDYDSLSGSPSASSHKSMEREENRSYDKSAINDKDRIHDIGSDATHESDDFLSSVLWLFCHRSLELLIDLLSTSSLSIRTFVISFLTSIHWSVRSRQFVEKNYPKIGNLPDQYLLLTIQLIHRLQQLIDFPIRSEWQTNQSIERMVAMDSVDQRSIYFRRSAMVQKICFRHFSHKLQNVIYAGVGLLCSASFLRNAFDVLSNCEYCDLLHILRLIDKHDSTIDTQDRLFLQEILVNFLVVPNDLVDELQTFPLYPTEKELWNFLQIPASHTRLSISPVLSLPKLQTGFLSFTDYLLRNFELVRCESAFEIRADIVDAIRRLRPVARQVLDKGNVATGTTTTEFAGWARMALEIKDCLEIKRIQKQLLTEKDFSSVVAEFSIDLAPCGEKIRGEWDNLDVHDVLFLVAVDALQASGQPAPTFLDCLTARRISHRNAFWSGYENQRLADEDDQTFPYRYGVTAVRGCKIIQIRDGFGRVLTNPTPSGSVIGTKRCITVELDPTQYNLGNKSTIGQNVYQSLNVVVRRDGKSNNFHSVLDTIRGLMKGAGCIGRVIPFWLQPMLLGHGSVTSNRPGFSRNVSRNPEVAQEVKFLDYADTFLDENHLRSCFKDCDINVIKLNYPSEQGNDNSNHLNYRVRCFKDAGHVATTVEAVSYRCNRKGCGNNIRFTAPQVEAISSGLSPGLTLVVGPPGTGKSDTAVQIIASLYHSFPSQRTIIVTHSNAALNELFEKVMLRGDIEERYLLRLGTGERSLNSDSKHDFTKSGRVAYSLERRKELLEQVHVLAESIGHSSSLERGSDGSSAYTCQSAEVFYQLHVKKMIHNFQMMIVRNNLKIDKEILSEQFPFIQFFGVTASVLTLKEAEDLITQVSQIFIELIEYRPFELLRTQKKRSEYLISKQARVVAMTCTHAAIARSQLLDLGFEYDNLVIEEAGQMLEIETFIPFLLQQGESDTLSTGGRLKRLCLMGDPNQLPPVIQNSTFAKFSNLDQSMFARLIRSGVPYVLLDKQGRSRPEIANLYRWRYPSLKNMDHVHTSREFVCANAGMLHSMQLIDVGDYDGKGEHSPSPFFYQNLGEAEYVVALFQYLVLIGHPPDKISILTTYNGQKDLISDVISHRCGSDTPLAGCTPFAVATVDQYQGQQNDIILLSLVRTKSVGHFRDIRRLVVAVSRARLGLYIFCRQQLFCNCYELKSTLDQLISRPTKLRLVLGEGYPTERKQSSVGAADLMYEVEDVMHMGNLVYKMQKDLLEHEES